MSGSTLGTLAPAVAAGAVAKKWLKERHGVVVRGYLSQLGIEHSDEMTPEGFLPDNAGGIL